MTLATRSFQIFTILFLLLISRSSQAQFVWTQPESGISTELKAVDFADAATGYAVGNSGVILKTIDGGRSWTKLTSPTNVNLWNVKVISGEKLMAVGDDATIIVSTDGGAHWTKAQSPMGTGEFLFGIQIFDANTFFVSGGRFNAGSPVGAFMRSTDAGATWTLLADVESAFFIDRVQFVSNDVAYAVGASLDFGKGMIVKSTDAGASWQIILDAPGIMNSLVVHSPQSITAVGSPGIITRTNDGGVTWEDQQSEITGDVIGITYASETHGFATGEKFIETRNGGQDWVTLPAPTSSVLNGVIYLPQSGVVIAVGNGGTIVRGASQAGVSVRHDIVPTSSIISDVYEAPIAGELRILDITGREVMRSTVTLRESIDMDYLAAGVYSISITDSEDIVHVQKVLKQ